MPLFRVHLTEIRRLTAYVDAKDSDTAVRRCRAAWSKVEHSAPLPFELRAAKLVKASMAASRVTLRPGKPRRSSA
jgi:hypothetical protein